MKFLCVGCDAQMISVDRAAPDDGTLAIVFACPECRREVAMLANPMETQMVRGLCVEVGGRSTPERPLEGVRAHLGARSPDESPPTTKPIALGGTPGRRASARDASDTGGASEAGDASGTRDAPGAADASDTRDTPGAEGTPGMGDRPGIEARPGAAAARPSWSPEAEARLGRVPGFVRGMVRQLYSDWALEHGVGEITVEMMDRARADVGLEDT